jgi:alpha-L-glutamate ligase-like protein
MASIEHTIAGARTAVAARRGWLARVVARAAQVAAEIRVLRREALGMNRRNLAFLVPYNPHHLFALVDHKPSTKRALAARGIPVPETYAELTMQWDLRGLASLLRDRDDFAVKPARGSGGGGVQVIAGRRAGRFLKTSGAELSLADLESHCADILAGAFSVTPHSDDVLIEYRVRTDPVLGTISFRGVPDVRVLVFRGVPIQAMLRLPTRVSDGRANLHMGGMAVGIDLATGLTTHGTIRGRATDLHPDLRRSVAGVTVPAWDEIVTLAARSYDAVPLGYLGVDVVLDADRGPLVLELNARPGLTIQLANRRGLRPLMETVARTDVGGLSVSERIALGRELAGGAG